MIVVQDRKWKYLSIFNFDTAEKIKYVNSNDYLHNQIETATESNGVYQYSNHV